MDRVSQKADSARQRLRPRIHHKVHTDGKVPLRLVCRRAMAGPNHPSARVREVTLAGKVSMRCSHVVSAVFERWRSGPCACRVVAKSVVFVVINTLKAGSWGECYRIPVYLFSLILQLIVNLGFGDSYLHVETVWVVVVLRDVPDVRSECGFAPST